MNMKIVAVVSSLVGLAAGGAAGFFVANKRLEVKYKNLAEKEIAEAKEYYRILNKTDEFSTPERAAEALEVDITDPDDVTDEDLAAVVEGLRYGRVSDTPPGAPRVISVEEFTAGEAGFAQATLTYYQGDDTLVDEGERVIDDIERTVGRNNLGRFGFRSNDPRAVYIRCPGENMDFEVVLHDGTYAEQLGDLDVEDLPRRPRR